MSFLRGADRSLGASSGVDARASKVEISERRAVDVERLGVGSLACRACDAPVSLGADPRALSDRLRCPFCGHSGPARDFLSLGTSRPARVTVWVTRRAPA